MKSLQTLKVVAALLFPLLLSACGGGGGNAPAPTVPVAPPVVVAPPPPLKYPIPAGMWSAPAGATPASGNYVYLQSDNGDYIGGGRSYSYTNANAIITPSANGLTLQTRVEGDEAWTGDFLLPSAAGKLQAGYFAGLTRTPFADSAVGGVNWTGEGRGCNTLKGWVIIDKIELSDGAVTALDLRFEQHCEGGSSALRGQVHWTRAGATVNTPVPAAIPADLWQPAAGMVPASGSYVYLQGSQGDYIGAGRTYLYTPVNAALTVTASDAYLGIRVAGDESWDGNFKARLGMTQLAVGYYDKLQRYPFNNPVFGGFSWSGEGRGCNGLDGWVAIDKVTYSGATLTAIDLRFEQHCEGSGAPLRGQVRWRAGDNVNAPGPVSPVPTGLWTPDASFVAPAGNYVYLVSDNGDYIGGGRTQLLTAADTTIDVTDNLTAALAIRTGGWTGDFVGMNLLSQLQPGYYGNLQRYPFHNARRGGMNWSGNGRGCNTLEGWFVVDHVSYTLGKMTAVDLRFEQHCEGHVAAQRGVIHWRR